VESHHGGASLTRQGGGSARRDGQITIYEIISSKKGNGTKILDFLKGIHGGKCIVAKCPDYLSANEWYKRKGFVLKDKEKNLNVWCLEL